MKAILALLALLALSGCGGEEAAPEPAPKAEKAKKAKTAKSKGKKAKGPKKYEPLTLPAGAHEAMMKPKLADAKAPNRYKVKMKTTQGDFVIDVHRDWSPNGADRFYNLVKIGFMEDAAFFRNIKGFMVQFGISPYPAVSRKWRSANIKDDPVKESNKRGYVTFAKTGAPNSRSTQIFISFKNNAMLDKQGFSPFGTVDEAGMKIVNKLYQGYGEGPPRGRGPHQNKLVSMGNAYLKAEFPKLDYIKKAIVVGDK